MTMNAQVLEVNERSWLEALIACDSLPAICKALSYIGFWGVRAPAVIFAELSETGYLKYGASFGVEESAFDGLAAVHFSRTQYVSKAFANRSPVFVANPEETRGQELFETGQAKGLLVVPVFEEGLPAGVFCFFTDALIRLKDSKEHTWQLGTLWAWYRFWRASQSNAHTLRDQTNDKVFLTDRQKDIALLILRGHTNGEVSSALHLSEATVKSEVTKMFRIFRVTRRADLKSALLDVKDSF
jgi:DNA-binding CsgD family transcriptional regulator